MKGEKVCHPAYVQTNTVYFLSYICNHICHNLTWFLKFPFPVLFPPAVIALLVSSLIWSCINFLVFISSSSVYKSPILRAISLFTTSIAFILSMRSQFINTGCFSYILKGVHTFHCNVGFCSCSWIFKIQTCSYTLYFPLSYLFPLTSGQVQVWFA